MPRHKGVHRLYKSVVSDFKVYWDDPIAVRSAISSFEGKRMCAIFYEDQEIITGDQWAFYFGVVIKECQGLEEFAGFTKKEVHQVLFSELRSYQKRVQFTDKEGNEISKIVDFQEDFESYGKKDMAKYMEELIPRLALDRGLFIKDPGQYKIDQFIRTK